jgi:hypothetical protein
MCISSQNPLDVNKDYFPANTRVAVDGAIAGTATVTVAGDFSITYHKYFKVVKNLQTDPVKTYILRICGSDAPTKYPDGTAIEAGAKHFSVPVKGVGIGGSTPSAFLEPLDLLDEVKLADVTYAHSPCLHAAQVAGDITQESANFASKAASETSVELVLTDKWNVGTCACDKDVVFDASGGTTPLGRAEWIKYLATFFNEEDRANLVFSREKSAYDATKALATAAAALYELTKAKKKCAWIGSVSQTVSPYARTHWKLDNAAYKLKYCTDAGMEPVTDLDGSGEPKNYAVSGTDLNTALADVDVIIDETYAADPATTFPDKASVLSNLGITLKEGAVLLREDKEVHDTSSSHNYAWAESAIARPAHVLQGLVHAVWPNSVKAIPDSCIDYFRDMTAGEAVREIDHTHCTTWDNANAESQCITNILSDGEMAALRDSPAAKPSFIVAIVVALVVAFIGA